METPPPNFDLTGRVAIITGASRGIGRAIAEAYARAGARVVLASRTQETLDAVADAVRSVGGEALAVAAHTGDADAVARLVERTVEAYGGVDILVNNAATNPHYGPILTASESQWDKILDVNVKGYARLVGACVPHMRNRGGGSVINVSSLAGLEAFPGLESSRVWYRPPPGDGESGLRVAVSERPGFPPSLARLGRWTLRSVASRKIQVESAGPGALAWAAAARPWSRRPELELEASTPGLIGAPGAWTARGSWERRTYGFPEGAVREERFTTRLGWTRWIGADLRTGVSAGLYRWPGRGRSVAAGGSLEWRSSGDRLAVTGLGAGWTGPGGGSAFARLAVAVSARSTTERDGLVGRVNGGFERTTSGAPPSEWPGAGQGEVRPILLRAHPLLDDGTIRGEAFGRRLAWAGASGDLWVSGPGPVLLGFGAFLDAAKAWERPGGIPPSPLHVDAGFGLRLALGDDGGALFLDVARGLEDGASAFDVGWHASWPGDRACCGFP